MRSRGEAGSGAPTRAAFTWPVRVYYEDTDSAGLVYYASYLRFMERARTEWLRGLGFEHSALAREQGVAFAVARLGVDYLVPARLDDELEVDVTLARLTGARLDLGQRVRRGGAELLARAEVTIACIDAATHRPRRIPRPVTLELAVES